ncbi:BlpZ protein, fusion [Streptococcus pneumoniae]|nr:BlpZ protein, fusion [Streptococcus pneumoniae]
MYKHLFFLDSKTLDRLTPYILVLASDTIAFNVFCAHLCICGGF